MSKVINLPKSQVQYVEVTKYDGNGEIISEQRFKARNRNGSGYVLSYTEKMSEFIEKHSGGAVVRIFVYLAHHQQYGVDGVYGYRCSRKHLEQALGVDRKTVYSALTTLKGEFLVIETKVDGVSEFMVNPNYVTIGKDKASRVRVWNERWEKFFKAGGKV